MGILNRILETKRAELAGSPWPELPTAPEPRRIALKRAPGDPLRLIAEIKRRSPSAGQLSTVLSVAERARAYERAGARMLSVLCDRTFFDGAFEHLAEARAACTLPILCKEFIIDERQLDAARAFGADAVLLIVRCLEPARVLALVEAARARGLEPLVEITTEEEARIALGAGADWIGVNARDLDTLQMDKARTERVLGALPSSIAAVHLSGLATADAVRAVAEGRADAALIGEALMRQDDPVPLLSELVAAGRSERAARHA